jgi:hypothetical protein
MDTSSPKESDAIRTSEPLATESTSLPGTVVNQEGTFQDDDDMTAAGNYGEVAYVVDAMTLVSTFSDCSTSAALSKSESSQSSSNSRSSRRSRGTTSKSAGSGNQTIGASSGTREEATGSGIHSGGVPSEKTPRSVGSGNRSRGASSRTSYSARSGHQSIGTSHSRISANPKSGPSASADGPLLGELHVTLDRAPDGEQDNHSTTVLAIEDERDDAVCDETDACDHVVREEPSAGDCNIDDLIYNKPSVWTCNESVVTEKGVSVVTEEGVDEEFNAGHRHQVTGVLTAGYHTAGVAASPNGGYAVASASNLSTNKATQEKPDRPSMKVTLMGRSMKRLHVGMASKRFTKSTTKDKDSAKEASTATDQYKPEEKSIAKSSCDGKASAAFWRHGPGISNHVMTSKKISWMVPSTDQEVAGSKHVVFADHEVAKLSKLGDAASELEDEAETKLTPATTEVEVLKRGKTKVSRKKKINILTVKNGMVNLMKSSKKDLPVAATGKFATDEPATDKSGVINTHTSDAPAEVIKSSPSKNEDSKGKTVDKRELLRKCDLPASCRLMPYLR